ncbi:hypothetical protein ACLKA6_012802 [Drosophila palustris]
MIRTISKSTLYVKNQAIRDRFNLQSVSEVFDAASHNFANTLTTHTNIEARKMVTNPLIPTRLRWPRYSKQLNSHILPIQQSHGHHQQQQELQQQQNGNFPTLIQLLMDENQIRIQEGEQLRQQQLLARRSQQPVRRLEEYEINNLRRSYANGDLTREEIITRIQGQHWQIQQLVMPELHQDQTRTFPEGWLSRKEYYKRRRQQGRLSGRLTRAAAVNIPESETISISDDDTSSIVATGEQSEQQLQAIEHHRHHEIQNPPEIRTLSVPEGNHCVQQQQQQDSNRADPQQLDILQRRYAGDQQPRHQRMRKRWQLESSPFITNTWQTTRDKRKHTHEKRPPLSWQFNCQTSPVHSTAVIHHLHETSLKPLKTYNNKSFVSRRHCHYSPYTYRRHPPVIRSTVTSDDTNPRAKLHSSTHGQAPVMQLHGSCCCPSWGIPHQSATTTMPPLPWPRQRQQQQQHKHKHNHRLEEEEQQRRGIPTLWRPIHGDWRSWGHRRKKSNVY